MANPQPDMKKITKRASDAKALCKKIEQCKGRATSAAPKIKGLGK